MTDHLNADTKAVLELADSERTNYIRSPRWIGYPRAKVIQDKLEDLLVYPKAHRMPNLLIVGETNNGKTSIVQRFRSKHPGIDDPSGEGVVVPVLDIQAPPFPDEGRFYGAILDRLFSPYSVTARIERKQNQAIRLLKYVGLRMLVIDELQNVLVGSTAKQRGFLNVIKFLGNELRVPIIGVGTREAFQVVQTDPQLANRFEPAILPRWDLSQDFLRLLASFERMLPLKNQSVLTAQKVAVKILAMTEGYIGELSQLLAKAAINAIESGTEQITLETLASLDWTAPSDRQSLPARMF